MSRAPIAVAFILAVVAHGQVRAQTDHGTGPAVSPDGKRIAFRSDRGQGAQIFLIDADGTNERQMTHVAGDLHNPGWAADGRVLYSITENDSGPSTLYAYDPATSETRTVATVSGRDVRLFGGDRLAFVVGSYRNAQIATAMIDGSGLQVITGPPGLAWNPAVSPNGKQLAFTHPDTGRRIGVWVTNLDGTNAHAVAEFAPGEPRAQVPAWSADGQWLAFQASERYAPDSTKHTGYLWIANMRDGKLTKLAPHEAPYLDEWPSWFPDGKRLALQSDRTGRMEVWVMNVDGTNARQITR